MSRSRGGRTRIHDGGSQSDWLTGVAFVGILALVAALGWALWNYSRSQRLEIPLAVGAGFDISRSVSKEKKQRGVALLNEMIDAVLPSHTPIKIWRYAETIQTVHESSPIVSDDLLQVSKNTIENHMGSWGTRPDKVMEEFLRYIRQQPERKAIMCLFTDGECHAVQKTRKLAAQLAEDPQVVAVVVGPVLNEYRASVENEYYAPLRESGKLFIFGDTDALDTLNRLKERLHALEN